MLCPLCGNNLPDDAKFCGACGARLQNGGAAAPQQTEQPERTAVSESAPRSASPAAQSDPHGSVQVASPAPVPVPQQKGVLGQAWSDITSTDGWIKRVLLLIVMNVVPVLNFFVTGYMLQWGADASRGVNPTMPKHAFNLRAFMTGLFYWILSLLMTVSLTWTSVLLLLPVLGWIAMVVIPFFALAFTLLASMRMALFGTFGKAFDLSELFLKYKSRLGSLFAAACVPNIVVVAVIVVVLAMLSFGGCAAGASMMGGARMGSASMGDMIGGMLLGAGVGLVVVVLVALLAVFFLGVAQIWSMRAVGIWVARNAPDWEVAAREEEAKRAR